MINFDDNWIIPLNSSVSFFFLLPYVKRNLYEKEEEGKKSRKRKKRSARGEMMGREKSRKKKRCWCVAKRKSSTSEWEFKNTIKKGTHYRGRRYWVTIEMNAGQVNYLDQKKTIYYFSQQIKRKIYSKVTIKKKPTKRIILGWKLSLFLSPLLPNNKLPVLFFL